MPRRGIFVGRDSQGEKASLEKGDSPRGGEMPAGQRGPLSTRGTSEAGGGILMWNLLLYALRVRLHGRNPSVKPAACQLPFQGSPIIKASLEKGGGPAKLVEGYY